MDFFRLTHPGQPNMFVECVLASRHKVTGRKVYTLRLRYPRIIHGEMMTHRVFNRNARSSRAVPIKTMLNEVRSEPFIPWHWTGHQKGMQGVPNHNELVTMLGSAAQFVDADMAITNEAAWLHLRDVACDGAEAFFNAHYAKQIANRLVEPFMWMDLLVTSTEWANFLHLRDHPAAEPHLRDLAVLVGQVLEQAPVQDLLPGGWHLPYVTDEELGDEIAAWVYDNVGEDPGLSLKIAREISAARCARISYAPFDGNPSYEREIERFDGLVSEDVVHASPLEHQCAPDEVMVTAPGGEHFYRNYQLHGPLVGFIQHRKLIPNEAIRG